MRGHRFHRTPRKRGLPRCATVAAAWVGSLGLAGCAPGASLSEPRPLSADAGAHEAPPPEPSPPSRTPEEEAAAFEAPTGTLTLREALAAALVRNPSFAAASGQVRIREAEALQAGLRPNPELETEMTDFGGTGETSGFDVLETKLSVIQPLELGGDREKRLALARQERELAGWDYEAKRLEVMSETRRRFLRALVAERSLRLMEKAQALESDRPAEGERDDAEKEAPVVALAEVDERLEGLSIRLDRRRAERARERARRALAAMWGSASATFDRIVGDLDPGRPPSDSRSGRRETSDRSVDELDPVLAPPPLEALVAHLERHPRVARWEAEIERHRAARELAEAEAFPDLEARVGGVHTRETDDYGLEVEMTLPVPLFDREQGSRLAARREGVRAAHRRRSARLELRQELREAHAKLELAADEARSLTERVLPAAEHAVDAAERAVEADRSSRETVLEARRKRLEVRRQRLEALADYHRAVIDVEELIARSLRTLRSSQDEDASTPADRQRDEAGRAEP